MKEKIDIIKKCINCNDGDVKIYMSEECMPDGDWWYSYIRECNNCEKVYQEEEFNDLI